MTEIIGIFTALGHLTNVTKTLYQAHTEAERTAVKIELQGAVIDLQTKVSTLQADYQALIESNEALKKKLSEYDQWDREAARYELKQLADGIFVYALRSDQQKDQPLHFLCPHCFGDKKRSILQRPSPTSRSFVCHACKMKICPEEMRNPGFSIISDSPFDAPMT